MTNDQGTYDIDPAAPAASQLRAIETAGQREQLLSLYRENRKTLRRWPTGHPPQCYTAFGPQPTAHERRWIDLVHADCDVSSSLIALIAQFVDQRLERFVANSSKGSTIRTQARA
jgi:hypothetical protein